MEQRATTILLIEDNRGDVVLIRRMLETHTSLRVQVEAAERLADGLERLGQGGIDAVLLDLGLPDSNGLDTVRKVHAHAPDVPIIVLTGHDDEVLGANAVWAGAQDYLVKGQADASLLARAIRYAIGRTGLQRQMRGQATVDELTGLLNRRGLAIFAEQHLKLAARRGEHLSLIAARIEGLARVRAAHGNPTADRLVREAVQALQRALRESDVLARVAPDEFALLAVGADAGDTEPIIRRLRRSLETQKHHDAGLVPLTLATGVATTDPKHPTTAEALLRQAHEAAQHEGR